MERPWLTAVPARSRGRVDRVVVAAAGDDDSQLPRDSPLACEIECLTHRPEIDVPTTAARHFSARRGLIHMTHISCRLSITPSS